jgi:hypothetical protein
MDFMLSKDNVNEGVDLNDCIAADLNFSNIKNNFVVSNVAWKESVPSTTILHNIGFTGVDNGFLKYERDRISNDEFLEIFTRSEFIERLAQTL